MSLKGNEFLVRDRARFDITKKRDSTFCISPKESRYFSFEICHQHAWPPFYCLSNPKRLVATQVFIRGITTTETRITFQPR